MTPIVSIWPLAAILVSLLGALPIILSDRQPNLRESWTILIALVKLAIVASLLPGVLQGGGYVFTIAQVLPGVPIELRVDALGMIFALVASCLWLFTSIYSIGYMRALDEHAQTRYFASFAVAISATIGVAFAGQPADHVPLLRGPVALDLPAGHPRTERRSAGLRAQVPDLYPRHLHRPGPAGHADDLQRRRNPRLHRRRHPCRQGLAASCWPCCWCSSCSVSPRPA